jgi:hypothetical protein
VRSRRWWLGAAAAALLWPSCTPGFELPSKVRTVRILAVTADAPYADPGERVTLRMTLEDGKGDPDSGPRPIQIVWLAGCVDPEGDQYFLCLGQLAELLGPLAQGGDPPEDLVKIAVALPVDQGTPNKSEFSFELPDDIVSRRPAPAAGPHYGIEYVFFAACAGQIAPAPLTSTGGEVPDFPLYCLDTAGNRLGADSFVIGYTQVYAFADGRRNANPPVDDITIDGTPIPDDPDLAPVVPLCPVSEEERRLASCGAKPTEDCQSFMLKAIVGDVAEVDPEAFGIEGEPLREVLWVSYFSDGGDFDPSLALVSDATKGYQDEHETEWSPPPTPGLYQLWAVVRDQRGGQTVIRRWLRVQ